MRGQGPAYSFPAQPGIHDACLGLTKRELFAAMAMQGLLASGWDHAGIAREGAETAVNYADALLRELEEAES